MKTKLTRLNKHINFNRESKKKCARKDLTEITCIKCKQQFILSFKPRDPKVYCDKCFKNIFN